MTSIQHTAAPVNLQFTPNGYPINPATGRMYSRAEIVADSTIPYPLHVDPANPGPYWQRRSQAELAAESKRIAAKNKRNEAARERRQGQHSRKGFVNLATTIAAPTLALVERVNPSTSSGCNVETFVNETTDPLAPDPDLTDGPRNMGESIMELNGQDYKAARLVARQRIAQPTAEQARRGLETALKPDWTQTHSDRRAQFGRGR